MINLTTKVTKVRNINTK